jgi:hypothetical protein
MEVGGRVEERVGERELEGGFGGGRPLYIAYFSGRLNALSHVPECPPIPLGKREGALFPVAFGLKLFSGAIECVVSLLLLRWRDNKLVRAEVSSLTIVSLLFLISNAAVFRVFLVFQTCLRFLTRAYLKSGQVFFHVLRLRSWQKSKWEGPLISGLTFINCGFWISGSCGTPSAPYACLIFLCPALEPLLCRLFLSDSEFYIAA